MDRAYQHMTVTASLLMHEFAISLTYTHTPVLFTFSLTLEDDSITNVGLTKSDDAAACLLHEFIFEIANDFASSQGNYKANTNVRALIALCIRSST